jgi:PAS domain S-box-containing protein
MNGYAQPWRVMQEVDTLLMKTIPWSERLERIGHSLLRLLDSDAIWLLTAPQLSGIACGIIRSPLANNPQACVVFTDLAPPPIFAHPDMPLTQVLQAGVPRLVSEVPFLNGHLDNDLADALLRTLKVHPSLIVPLLVGDEPVGAMVVAGKDSPSDDTLPMDTLQAIGEHLGVTLQSAYVRDASRRQAEALATLNRIAHTITSSLDIEEVIQRTMAGINEVLDVEAGSLLLVDQDTNELYFKITLRGENPGVTEFRLQPGQGIAGWVVANGAQAVVNDVSTDPRFFSGIDEAIGFKTKSVLCAPLVVQGHPIGALEAINKRQGYFTKDDQDLLVSMSASLAVALQNAGLYEEVQQRVQRTAILGEIATAINASLSLVEASQAIANNLHKLVPFDYANVCLLDDNARHAQVLDLTRQTGHGHQIPMVIRLENSGLEWIVQTSHARLMDLGGTEEPRLDTNIIPDPAMRQMISAPLVAQEKVRGVINLASTQADAYSPQDVEMLEQIAPQLTVAIEKAQLFDLMERRTAELQTLNRMGERLVSTTDTNRILSIALSFVPHLVPGDIHALLLVDEDDGYLGLNLPFAADQSLVDKIIQEMINTLAPLIEVEDLDLARRKIIAGQKPMPEGWAPVATLTLPIVTRLGPMGIAHLASSKTEDFAGDALRVFSLVVSQIATAVENARLFREVEKERARLSTFLSSTTDLIIVVDRTSRVVLANPAAREVLGLEQEWENQLLADILQNEPLLELFSKAEQLEATFGEVPLPDGRTLHASISPISSGEEQTAGWVATLQDVSYLKELDEMKTEFINAVSHDLRSPLSGILIATHLVSQTGEVNAQQLDFLETIEQRVAAMTELIDDLLDAARVEAGIDMELEPCAVAPLISQVVSQLEEQVQDKQLQLEVKADTNLPPVMGNAQRLRQVLSNLISNAIKYTPDGGEISVSAKCSHNEIVVSIQDTGIGIPLTDQPHIFDKFYRVERPEQAGIKGTGLGLAITHSIVEKLEGRIWVRSEVNAGSTFSFALPTIQDMAEEPQFEE